MRILLISFVTIAIFFLASCGDDAPKTVAKVSPIDSLRQLRTAPGFDFSKFDFHFDDSIKFPAQITAIETKLREGFFKKDPNDEYDKTRDGNGYDLAIHYTLTNPYPTVQRVGIYDYNFIGSKDFFIYYDETTFDKSCQCRINNSSDTWLEGKKLDDIREYCHNKTCIEFQPGETKEFIVRFQHPFYESAQKVIFGGLNNYYKDGWNMLKEIYFIIDVVNKKVVGDSVYEPAL
jgi:hypothetical protein